VPVVLTPDIIQKELNCAWEQDKELMSVLLNKKPINSLFLEFLVVAPNRFRPETKGTGTGTQTYLNIQTVALLRILSINHALKSYEDDKNEIYIERYLEMQHAINMYMDSSNWSRQSEKDLAGLRQLLEKKEGLFRLKMMGKRVNYAARSVISPDPYIHTNEIGIPVVFAKTLTFPEPVRENNLEYLRKLVENGPHNHPGANIIEEKDGTKVILDKFSQKQLKSIAARLYTGGIGKIVYRHLETGDWLLVNRQPTLHKPSMMAHMARVLPKQTTIRMHYSNCNTYNADFDGDEINLHFFQSQLARSEAKHIASTDYQYTGPTSGKPLRGLIQDHVVSGVLLCSKDTFLERDQYMQLIFIGTSHLNNTIQIPPCIYKPKLLWSGKQVISTIIKALSAGKHQMNLNEKCKVHGGAWGPAGKEEERLIIKQGYVCTGILDKNHIGNVEFGLVHAFHELYGETSAAMLLTSLGRVLTMYLQIVGFSCSMDDLILKPEYNKIRLEMGSAIDKQALDYTYEILNASNTISTQKLLSNIEFFLLDNESNRKELDVKMISLLNVSCSKLQSKCMPFGLFKRFPSNSFSAMVITGAKGSTVNHNQISLMLGQQELEGRRVPLTSLGRSVPSFDPYDPTPRANGLILDRFLTGIKPQEFFFHCMAGREGLVDTAVKTSRSGYLQRCLIKGLESLVVGYDYTVRDSDRSIIQFLYGEDSVDPSKNKYLKAFDFLCDNQNAMRDKLKYRECKQKLDFEKISEFENYDLENLLDSALHRFSPASIGSLPTVLYKLCNSFVEDKKSLRRLDRTIQKISKSKFESLVSLKYMNCSIQPGESVGIIASQSIGEPSTQLTLNTFHLAGHGSVNVTLGIPRLREILMTASSTIKTPTMTLPFKHSLALANDFKNKIQKISFKDLIKKIKIHEKIIPSKNKRTYTAKIMFEDKDLIEAETGITWEYIYDKVQNLLVINIDNAIANKIKKTEFKIDVQFNEKKDLQGEEEVPQTQIKKDKHDKDDNEKKKKEISTYDNESEEIKSEYELPKEEKVENTDYKCLKKCTKSDKNSYFKVIFEVPMKYNILVLSEIEKQLESTFIRELSGIGKCHANQEKDEDEVIITTEGVNFSEIWKYENLFELNRISSNDVVSVLKTYGVEAAGRTIVNEIGSIFSHYGISVDKRHLNLISDFMTFNGGYRPFNRFGMNENPSPLLRMSYETTMNYLSDASLINETDPGRSPSACIVLGKPTRTGTNYMDIFQVINN
jgi:DNA-directed RNA polymerase I subunit RPA1